MADNITVTPGTGANVAADDISGVLYQRVKISVGADGAATDLSSANPMPIQDNGGSITVDGSVAITSADLASIAGAIAGTNMSVDVTGSALPAGAASEAKQDTTIGYLDGIETSLGTINADTTTIAGAITAAKMQADIISSALPDGAATASGQSTEIAALADINALLTTIDAYTSALADSISGTEIQADIVTLPADANKDGGPAWDSIMGVSGAAVISSDATTATAVTDAPTSGEKIVVTDIHFSVNADMVVQFIEETSGTILFNMYCLAKQSYQLTPRSKCKLAVADKKLMVSASIAGAISVTVFYYSEA